MTNDFRIPVPVRIVKPRRVRHVPANLRPHLEESFRDADGYWFYFSDAVIGGACGTSTVHEDTLAECRAAFACLKINGYSAD